MASAPFKTRILAGVKVPDTPLITAILDFSKEYYDEMSYNHVVRSWLLGALIASKTPTFTSPISDSPVPFDAEIQAISALTHDVAWDCRKAGENFCTATKRFEVDCADGAITVLKRHFKKQPQDGVGWDDRKLQLLWDAVALHSIPSIAYHKEPEVAMTCSGVRADFVGTNFPGGLVTWDEWDVIVAEFPRVVKVGKEGVEEEFKVSVMGLLKALCEDKPETTYDNLVGNFGEAMFEEFKEKRALENGVIMEPDLKR